MPFDLPINDSQQTATFKVTVVSAAPHASLDAQVLKAFATSYALPPGNTWYVVKFRVTNTGHSKAYWGSEASTLVAGQDSYSQSQSDADATNSYDSFVLGNGQLTSDFEGLNPRATGTTYGVWDIPKDVTPSSLVIPEVNGSANVDATTPTIQVTLH